MLSKSLTEFEAESIYLSKSMALKDFCCSVMLSSVIIQTNTVEDWL